MRKSILIFIALIFIIFFSINSALAQEPRYNIGDCVYYIEKPVARGIIYERQLIPELPEWLYRYHTFLPYGIEGTNELIESSLAPCPLLLPPTAPLSPRDGAKAIKLTPDLSLILEWKPAAKAEEYRYQYWKLGDAASGFDKEETVETPKSKPINSKNLEPKAKYFWHVRSCADLNTSGGIEVANECGEYSDSWSFTFLLLPPNIVAPTSDGTNLPVRFDWEDVPGANSYLIRGEIDFSNGFWGNILGFLSNPGGWFFTLGVNFLLDQLGINDSAVVCPYAAFWDEKTEHCEPLGVRKDQQGLLPSEYRDTDCLFTKNTKYQWQAASCLKEDETFCGPYGSKESFQTNDVYYGVSGFKIPAPQLQEPRYDPAHPAEILTVGFEDLLSWDQHECGHFSKVRIKREGKIIQEALETEGIRLSSKAVRKVWDAMDAVYEWSAQPCFIGNDQEIRCEATVSDIWKFKTTGAAPQNPRTVVSGRVEISWDAVPKAGSYHYQVATSNTFSQGAIKKDKKLTALKTIIEHPDIAPSSSYWWRVRTCVDPTGVICGTWTAPQQFTTLPLTSPSAPVQPTNGGQAFLPGSLNWQPDPGSSYYQYQASYLALAPDETLQGCQEKVGTQLMQPFPITQQTSFFLDEKCAGEYRWAVRSCADQACALATDWSQSQLWTFTGKEGPIQEQPGLVPCGRSKNDPATPYNEKEDCSLRHLGFLLQNLLDFILWKVSLFVLLLLAVMTGATSYFSLGGPNALARIKTVFRSFFVGFLILMFAWMLINIILMLFGFQFEFFGKWWELSF